jgi:DNA-binding NtrC family response regulator
MRALLEAGGSQKRAARILGIKYTTLNYKVKKHKIRIKGGGRGWHGQHAVSRYLLLLGA